MPGRAGERRQPFLPRGPRSQDPGCSRSPPPRGAEGRRGRAWQGQAQGGDSASGWGGAGTQDPYAVVVGAVDIPAHAEIADLHYQSLPHQAVARGQVPMHEVQSRQVHHPRSDLASHGQQLPQPQRAWSRVLPAGQQLGIRPVGPGKEGEKGWAP